ncbi:MAG: amino acid adenylation domain-containing protein, partial [bacterium]|nr:amino acid adenylation domain-containing protein [bacterium]
MEMMGYGQSYGDDLSGACLYEKERDYWLDKLSGEIVNTGFPYDNKNISVGKHEPKLISFKLEGETFSKLMKLSGGKDIRLHMILLGAASMLIDRYTGNNDVIIGSPIYRQEIDGDFINTVLALRNKIDGDATFRDLLLQVRKTVGDAVQHQNYPLKTLLYQLNMVPAAGEFPLFDAALLLEDIHEAKYLEDIDHNVTFQFSKRDACMEGTLRYNGDLYRRQTVERIIRHFSLLLDNAVSDIRIRLRDIHILSEEERKEVVEKFNDTGGVYPAKQTIDSLFRSQVEKTPHYDAVEYENQSLTYRELDERSDRLAEFLSARGVSSDNAVGIIAEPSIDMVIGVLAILKAGGAYLPIDHQYPRERKEYMVRDANVTILLDGCGDNEGEPITPGTFRLDDPAIYNFPALRGGRHGFNNLAYIIYTSGSTGKPKGVLVEHRNVVRLVKNSGFVELEEKQKILQTGALEFDASTFEIWGALLNGLSLSMIDKDNILVPGKLGEIIRDRGITTLWLTAPLFNRLLDLDIGGFAGLSNLLVGGDVLSPPHINTLRRHYPRLSIINGYGPTENTTFSATFHIDGDYSDSIPIGSPISNSTIYILDGYGNPVPVGVPGELFTGGDGVARGYLNNPCLSAEKFLANPFGPGRLYKTGDLAAWLPDGNIEFLGRKDHQVKIRGFRIEPGEIENRLRQLDCLKDAVVVVRESENDKFLCAYVIPKENGNGKKTDVSSLRTALTEILPDYMLPSYFIPLERFPLTANGKVDTKALPEPELHAGENYVPPRDAVEKKMVAVWAEVLGAPVDTIGIDSNFFDMGGHSLKATILVAEIQKELEVRLPLAEIFRTPTIRELCLYIRKEKKEKVAAVENTEKREYYPLSAAQKRMYILQKMGKNLVSYNIPMFMELTGKADVPKIRETFKQLIRRHESLRTVFLEVHLQPVQKILEDVDFKIQYEDSACDLSAPAMAPLQDTFPAAGEVLPGVIADFVRPFDFAQAPLLRVGLVKTGKERYILMVDMHHIITDGTSMGVFVNDFAALYDGKQLAPLKLQYKDFSQWHNRLLSFDEIKKQETFWKNQFQEGIPVLQLPTDYNRPAVHDFAGACSRFGLGEEEKDALKRLAARLDISLFMLLLSIYNILLAKLSGQVDIVVGTPVACRRHADLKQIIGMIVNTLALRNRPEGEKPVADFLREVKENTLEAFENQEYQFENLVDVVDVPGNVDRNPLFDVMFSLQNMDIPQLDLEGLTLKHFERESNVSKFDLTLTAVEGNGSLDFSFEYSTKLFKKETIAKYIDYFKGVVFSVLGDSGQKISEITLISPADRDYILSVFNDTRAVYPETKTIQLIFEEQAARTPGNVALLYNDEQLTYGRLNETSNRLAHQLRERGITVDTFAAVMLPPGLERVIGILGILKAGGAYLPLGLDYPVFRKKYIIEDSRACLLLTVTSLYEKEQDLWRTLLPDAVTCVDRADQYSGDGSNLFPISGPDSPAYAIYTSGTTGIPKGVLVEQRSAVNLLHVLDTEYPFEESDVYLLKTSYLFDVSLSELFGWFFRGGKLCVPSENQEKDARQILATIEREHITHINFVPSVCNVFINILNHESSVKLKTLKYVFLAGEAITPRSVQQFRLFNRTASIENLYGPTEATVYAGQYSLAGWDGYGSVPIGKPIPNVSLYILDRGRLQAPGVPGELCIGGIGLGRGYLNNPTVTAEKFTANPFVEGQRLYRTGDMARWLEDWNIEYLGRIDHQVKIRGYRIELGDIQSHLLTFPGVKEAIVTDGKAPDGDKYLCAYFVGDRSLEIEDLRNHLLKHLPRYMLPAYFMPLKQLPLTVTGKVNRRLLPAPEIKKGNQYCPPGDPVEETLVEMWAQLLNLEKPKISVKDNFFKLGGHSLRATLLLSRIQEEWNVSLTLVEIFKAPTIRGLRSLISGLREECFASPEAVEDRDYYPLSSAQKRLYFLHQMDPQSTGYNMPLAVAIEGMPDTVALEQALNRFIRRHESLRTAFLMVEEKPVQKIHDEAELTLEYAAAPKESAGDFVQGFMQRFIRPFDLSRPPLIRAGLVHTAKQCCVLVLDMHHIVGDGLSMQRFISEFPHLYAGRELAPLKLRYRDFVLWQNGPVERIRREGLREYWLKRLGGEIPVLDMPTDYPRPATQSFAGNSVGFRLGKEETAALKNLSRAKGATLYMTVLALYNVFLTKICGREDIIVGTDIAGRRHTLLEPLVGMFVNTLALRNYPEGSKSFAEFLGEVKEGTLDAFDNQEYPFEDLVEQLTVKRDIGRNPVFDVMFSYQDMEPVVCDIPGLKLKAYDYQNSVSKFDFTLNATEEDDHLTFTVEYGTALFKEKTIRRFGTYFKKIAAAVSGFPLKKLMEISIISKEEKKRILYGFNSTQKSIPGKCYHRLLEEQAARTPEGIAACHNGVQITYEGLNEASNRIASFLTRHGVKTGTFVALYINRSLHMLASIIGVFKAGAAYVPVEPSYPVDRVRYILENSEAALVIIDRGNAAAMDHIRDSLPAPVRVPTLELGEKIEKTLSGYPATNPGYNGHWDNLAYMIYTSGTTGKPKGAMIYQGGMVNHLYAKINDLSITAADIVAQTASACFDISVWQFLAALAVGGCTFIIDKEVVLEPAKFLRLLRAGRISILESVPSLMTAFLDDVGREAEKELADLRWMIPTGEALGVHLVRLWYKHYPTIKLLNAYGPTEASDDVTHYVVDTLPAEEQKSISIGSPLQNLHIYILDGNLSLCPVGIRGEICVSGIGVGKGYWKDPVKTEEAFIANPFYPELKDTHFSR